MPPVKAVDTAQQYLAVATRQSLKTGYQIGNKTQLCCDSAAKTHSKPLHYVQYSWICCTTANEPKAQHTHTPLLHSAATTMLAYWTGNALTASQAARSCTTMHTYTSSSSFPAIDACQSWLGQVNHLLSILSSCMLSICSTHLCRLHLKQTTQHHLLILHSSSLGVALDENNHLTKCEPQAAANLGVHMAPC